MDFNDFPAFFRSVHGHDQYPFPWQMRLLQQIVKSGRWPGWIDLPTASGKSATVDIAVFLLALSADGSIAGIPRRVFFVVDRRIVVDSVHERALRICERIDEAQSGLLAEMRERLLRLGGPHPLRAVAMRGGLTSMEDWATWPTQPMICTTTVDQLGSRMLFRGYGLSRGSRNMLAAHAGLTTHDTLVILDEVHLSRPFSETLEAIEHFRSWSEQDSLSMLPFQVVRMSATSGQEGEVFALDSADREDAVLGRRLMASKRVRLVRVDGVAVKGLKGAERTRAHKENRRLLVREFSSQLIEILDLRPQTMVAGCIVNRVKTARDLVAAVQERLAAVGEDGEVILLTGRQRGWDRRKLLDQWLPVMKASEKRVHKDRRLIVVATQCLEVGADVDFEVLVTENAPVDALHQRFGRLNRLGRQEVNAGVCGAIVHLDTNERTSEDRVYGLAPANTWKRLLDAASTGKRKGKPADNPEMDMGIESITERMASLSPADLHDLSTPREHAPVMMPAYLDLWAQTNPLPAMEPLPELFLHGKRTNTGDVQVVWRADLLPGQELLWKDIVSVCPPQHDEACPVPTWELRAFLDGKLDIDGSDVETSEGTDDAADSQENHGRLCLRWHGAKSRETTVIPPNDIRPGDTLILPSIYGGYRHDNLDLDSSAPVRDIANPIAAASQGGNLRVHWQLLADCLPDDVDGTYRDALQEEWARHLKDIAGRKDQGERPEKELDDLLAFLSREGFAQTLFAGRWELIQRQITGCEIYAKPEEETVTRVAYGFDLGIVLKRSGKSERRRLTDETEDTLYTGWIPLDQHLAAVEERVTDFARDLRLPDVLRVSLSLAGRWHDLGKSDQRFQHLLRLAGERVTAGTAAPGTDLEYGKETLLAKARPFPSKGAYLNARSTAGVPKGYRHEASSLAFLLSLGDRVCEGADVDLVRHLIASHHGAARPFLPFVEDKDISLVAAVDGQAVTVLSNPMLHRADSGVSDRFWTLNKRYGWFGLSFLEAILRLADHRVSEEETHV